MFSITNNLNVFFFKFFQHKYQGYLLTVMKQFLLDYLDIWSDIIHYRY